MAGIPSAKPGQVKIQWGKVANADPDFILCHGDGTSRSDAFLIMTAVDQKTFYPLSNTWEKSLLEDLEARGYDLKTLRISIEKKAD